MSKKSLEEQAHTGKYLSLGFHFTIVTEIKYKEDILTAEVEESLQVQNTLKYP